MHQTGTLTTYDSGLTLFWTHQEVKYIALSVKSRTFIMFFIVLNFDKTYLHLAPFTFYFSSFRGLNRKKIKTFLAFAVDVPVNR